MERMITAILIGGGGRGKRYTDIMKQMGDKFRLVAVAEPIQSRRQEIQQIHGLPDEMCFSDWPALLEKGKIADIAIICTMDRDHIAPALKAISLHYDLLLEKPVSPDPLECQQIALYAQKEGVKIVVCHVLRYTPLFTGVKELLNQGKIGRIISVNHEECVGNIHQSHSFVRGNWGNSQRSSCMLLQKSCHDIDLLQWLIGKKCCKVQSFGSLSYFRKENAPAGSPEYCIDGCPEAETCPYCAMKIYMGYEGRPLNEGRRTSATKEAHPTDEIVEKAMRTTQYGKCVFKCDNDVVDHQTVNMLFEDNITVTFTMNAFNKGGRFLHIMGTKGELHATINRDDSFISLYEFETEKTTRIPFDGRSGIANGHGGGDEGIVRSLYEYLTGQYTGCSISDIRTSVDNHLTVFAAEASRATGKVVDMEDYKAQLTAKLQRK